MYNMRLGNLLAVTVILIFSWFDIVEVSSVMQNDASANPELDPALAKVFSKSPKFLTVFSHMKKLLAKGNKKEAMDIVRKINEQFLYDKRLAKCVERLGSKAVCTNNVGFYLWAQLLAKDMMAENPK